MLKITRAIFLFLSYIFVAQVFAQTDQAPPQNNWGLAYFHGWMTDNNILPLIFMHDVKFEYGTTNFLDLSHTLSPDNPIRHFLQPIASSVEFANEFGVRNDPNGTIYEGDTYLMLRWEKFPWDKYVINTFGLGDGLSYVTSIPLREEQNSSNNDPKRLLNFLAVETTIALPKYPDTSLVVRIHHRCGAWGLFGAGNLSSNDFEVGMRYRF